jgi:hypothetical protein
MIKDNLVIFKALRLTGSFVFAILKASKNHLRVFLSREDRMNQDIKDNINADTPEKAFALLSSVTQDPILTVRDDLYDFSLLLDAVKLRRKQKPSSRFRLVDSGALSLAQVEWLAAEGADVYTSDEVGKNLQELENIQYACMKGHTLLAYLHNIALESEEESTLGLSGLKSLGADGVYLYLSNKDQKRNLSDLIILSDLCQRGQSRLVYYHHKDLDPDLFELGRAGAWVHVSDNSINAPDDVTQLTDVIHAARNSGSNLCLHVERGTESLFLEDLQKAGAVLIFKSALIDYRSPLRPLEEKARKQKIDSSAYFLYPIFL